MLKIFNTLTKTKEKFYAITGKSVNIYVCGVTVYDHCHIGHARTFTIFDMIVKYLRYCKYDVIYIRNITDVDDKIINVSKLNNENISMLTNRIIGSMHQDFKKLGLDKPTFEPKVTEHILDIINFIKILINKNHAYVAKNGDVLFAINTCKQYGTLSKQKLNKLTLNSRINTKNIKNNSNDFVLWKKTGFLDILYWDSPWGPGRPGWHIECSSINHVFFNNQLDIHGGGTDLLFPHHENERAQSICLNQADNYGRYWVHSGSLLIKNKKMSKSLNNTLRLNDLLKQYNGEIIRYFFLSTHYRKPLLYDFINLKNAKYSLKKLYTVLLKYKNNIIKYKNSILEYKYISDDFLSAMNDDFNTPKAISILFVLLKKIHFFFKERNFILSNQLIFQLRYLANIIGLLNQNPAYFLEEIK